MLTNILETYFQYFSEAKKKPKVKIEVEHPGALEIPEDKNFWEMPLKHYKKLVRKNGWNEVSKQLNNLVIWNKNKHPDIAKKAKDIREKLAKWVESVREKNPEALKEQKVRIKVEHPGALEIPEDKNFWEMPLDHYKKLIRKNGWEEVSKQLNNLVVWNKDKHPSIAAKAKSIREKLAKWVEKAREKNPDAYKK